MTDSTIGNKTAIAIQERDRRLIAELAIFRVIDREQAKLIASFGSTTRINARLLALTRAGLLKRAFVGTSAGGRKALYSVAPKGAALLGEPVRGLNRPSDAILVGDLFVEHQLAVNAVLLAFKHQPTPDGIQFRQYAVFSAPLAPFARVIPDGYVETEVTGNIRAMFLEMDRGNESSAVWDRKIDSYLKFATSGEFLKQFRHPQFRVLVVCLSDRRSESLARTVQKRTDKIFWFTTLDAIHRGGIWSPIWIRPNDKLRRALL
jgi:hypothetical protein